MYTKESLLSKKYTWGDIIDVIEIENYLIVKYYATNRDEIPEENISFHPYVNGYDTNCSFNTLDAALIHAVCCNAGHSRATEFINNMLSVKYNN